MTVASTHMLILSINTLLLVLHRSQCKTLHTIQQSLPLHDSDVLLSEDGNFALGFFSPENSTRRYIGIWYNRINEQTIVWVANRDSPINDASGVLSINSRGDLVLHCCSNRSSPLWSTNVSTMLTQNAIIAQLQNTGNFILFPIQSKHVLWQSFDHPADVMVPFLKLGRDRKSGMDRCLTSWKSKDDPGLGNFTHRIDQTGYPQPFTYKNGVPHWRIGPWMGLYFSGMPRAVNNYYIFNVTFMTELDELSGFYEMKNKSLFSNMALDPSGFLQTSIWHDQEGRWMQLWSLPAEQCDYYGACGPNSNCNPNNINQFVCTCLPGFVPKSPTNWFLRDGSDGCVRSPGVSTCRSGEGFVKVAQVKVPDTSRAHVEMSLSLKECKQHCLKNCSCTAFTTADLSRGGFGCLAWYDDNLLDTRTYSNLGQDLHVRVDAATLALFRKKEGSPGKSIIIATIVGSLILVLLLSFALFFLKKRRGKRRPSAIPNATYLDDDDSQCLEDLKDDRRKLDLRFFDLSTISTATNNFSFINKLGKGGFGSVYKGVLENGKEIAVKRLSKSSGQGIQEFKNEVKLIAKLQHRNLVKILGCCIQEEEKMLIYEYLPNKSLDSFLFDEEKKTMLDWRKRFEIAYGIAQGILYLHEHSRLRIIHRDLKASNVLLDASMTPKISDFGMARICGEDQIEGNTRWVVGTYGYMSPEYAMQGLFSIKSDVYSFGVLLLEIISGKRNSSFCWEDSSSSLIGHVWELWTKESCLDIVDPSIRDSYPEQEVLRCIQIGLLCVQELAKDRLTMSEVVFMLGNKVTLTCPNQPAYTLKREQNRADNSSSGEKTNSVNKVSLSIVEAR